MVKVVDIIVVNWNSGKLSYQAVEPYLNYKSNKIQCNVIIIDNGSHDESVEYLKQRVPRLIESKSNLGFSKACNLAYKESAGDYILLLNPDTISKPQVLEQLVSFLELNKEIAITGPKQLKVNGQLLRSCGRFPNIKRTIIELLGLWKVWPTLFKPSAIMTDWDHSESTIVDHVMGSYMLIKRKVLNEVGFLDERFFVYMEDMDMSRRIRLAGYLSYYNTEVSIFHEGCATGEKEGGFRLTCMIISRRKYWKKHFGNFPTVFLTILSLTVEPLLRILQSLIGHNETSVASIIRAYKSYYKSILSNSI